MHTCQAYSVFSFHTENVGDPLSRRAR